MIHLPPPIQPIQPQPTPHLAGNLLRRWMTAFAKRREHASFRTRFMFYTMLIAQVTSLLVLSLTLVSTLAIYIIVAVLVLLAILQYFIFVQLQRQKHGVGSSGKRLGLLIGIPLIGYAGAISIVSFLLLGDLFMLWIAGGLVILVAYGVLMVQKSWLIEIGQGDVLLTHAPQSYERELAIRGRQPPDIPPAVGNIIYAAHPGLYAQIYEYFDFGQPKTIEAELDALWTNVFTEAQDALASVKSAVDELAPLKKQAGAILVDSGGSPRAVLKRFMDYMKHGRSDHVLWIRPSEPCYLIWNQTNFVSVNDLYIQTISTQDGIPLDMYVSLSAFVDPEKIRVQYNIREIAKNPSPDTISSYVEVMLSEQIRKAALKIFPRISYIDAYKPGTQDAFRQILCPPGGTEEAQLPVDSLPNLEREWGILIYEPSIVVNIIMPEPLRAVFEQYVTADMRAEMDLARMRQYLRDIENNVTDESTKELIKMQIIALNAVDETSGRAANRKGRRGSRGAIPRIIFPELETPRSVSGAIPLWSRDPSEQDQNEVDSETKSQPSDPHTGPTNKRNETPRRMM